MKRLALILLLTLSACAERRIVTETPPRLPEPIATPAPKPQIKYVYVRSPEPTISAMTMPPLEAPADRPRNLASDVVKIFWPLLTLLAAGALLIAGLFIEFKVIDRQLALRRERRAMLKT